MREYRFTAPRKLFPIFSKQEPNLGLVKARFFLLVDLQEKNSDLESGGTKKKKKVFIFLFIHFFFPELF